MLMVLSCLFLTLPLCSVTIAADSLRVELKNGSKVTFVGAIGRWDADGNARHPVNPKAKFGQPEVDGVGKPDAGASGRWLISDLKPGRYDLVILVGERIRIDGFDFPPVLEFDPFVRIDQRPQGEDIKVVSEDIAKSPHFENKVQPLYFAGTGQHVRVLVQLLRDEATSYDGEFGQQVAVLRHEVWQYTNRYGTWSKEKRTRVFDRTLAPKSELRQWTWIWEPSIGGLEVGKEATAVRYTVPQQFSGSATRGLLPY
jgi:hypothetical protein